MCAKRVPRHTLETLLNNTVKDVDCLLWQGCLNTDGYPRVNWRGNTNGKVHRIVYALTHPTESIVGKVIRHTCDRPICINPSHLLSGTNIDNVHDRDSRGRNGAAILNYDEVILARGLYATGSFKQKELAALFGVHKNTMNSLLNYKHWKSVQRGR